jgi:hypothetical protein
MADLSEEPSYCPLCKKLLTAVDNSCEEMLDDQGSMICLACFEDRFLARFEKNTDGFRLYAKLKDSQLRLF